MQSIKNKSTLETRKQKKKGGRSQPNSSAAQRKKAKKKSAAEPENEQYETDTAQSKALSTPSGRARRSTESISRFGDLPSSTELSRQMRAKGQQQDNVDKEQPQPVFSDDDDFEQPDSKSTCKKKGKSKNFASVVSVAKTTESTAKHNAESASAPKRPKVSNSLNGSSGTNNCDQPQKPPPKHRQEIDQQELTETQHNQKNKNTKRNKSPKHRKKSSTDCPPKGGKKTIRKGKTQVEVKKEWACPVSLNSFLFIDKNFSLKFF